MIRRALLLWQKLARLEKIFLAVLLLDLVVALAAPASGWRIILTIAAWVLGIFAVIRRLRRHTAQIIWRLRNRLIVAYLFIAVVPILLIVALVASATYVITGQVAVYLVHSELERRIDVLAGTAGHPELEQRLMPYLENRFPGIQRVETPTGWKQASGLLLQNGRLYAWAHAGNVTLRGPITHDLLGTLVPGLGDVLFLSFSGATTQLDSTTAGQQNYTPPAWAPFDFSIPGASVISVADWNMPGKMKNALLVVHTRPSAVLGIVFGQKFDFGQAAVLVFLGVAILFLIFELFALIVGVNMTRTITGAVHNLYEGTQKVAHGDFSHRIAVQGADQLAELGTSFNRMTTNLERLIVVEKEKERLQSELEIAKEVQTQLFPKESPILATATIRGVCQPARMVSGDYYDFMCLPDSTLALAIGDVAGKGISAALLMAAIQSTMRTQLAAGASMAASAGNGRQRNSLSTSALVAQLNRQLYANTSPEKYATFYFGLFDESSSVLKYTNAGHLPPMLLREGAIAELEVTGTVVGAFPFSTYEEQEIELCQGDLLVAYTDGVVEPENPYGEQFGEDRLKELLMKYEAHESDEIIQRAMEAVVSWTGSTELQDDMTMLVVRRL